MTRLLLTATLAVSSFASTLPTLPGNADPTRTGGFMGGHAGSWYTLTGRCTVAPDGSPACEYTSPWDSEAIWASGGTQHEVDERPTENGMDPALWFTAQDPKPWLKVWPTTPAPTWTAPEPITETPEPSTCAMFLAGIAVCVGLRRIGGDRE